MLAAWEIPPHLLANAPEPPWGFPVELFRAEPDPPESPSRDIALEVLPPAGSVLDVGCGGGAAGLALAPPAGSITGVDDGAGMLESFAAAAAERDVAFIAVDGTWPDVADVVDPADAVVCHHVLYNVADLPPFVAALTNHARRRVVVELTDTHPMTMSAPLWQHFHGLARPTGPDAELAMAVINRTGVTPHMKRWSRPARRVPREAYVRLYRRRLCLTATADAEIDAMLAPTDAPRGVTTIWWDVD
jgi:SAM-dependent methyltransferase